MVKDPAATAGARDARKLVGLALELGALLFLIYYFQLESRAFFNLSVLAFGGFVAHYALPHAWRLPFFTVLSVGGLAVVFSWQALWMVAIGLGLIGLCHLPASWTVRVALLVAAGAVLALLRGGFAPAPWSPAIWPILASMFMFRLIVYVHDTRHEKTPATIWQKLAYFFLLPNACFPLFPVVDYKTFRRTYYDADRHVIYQTGVLWILRGLAQLILYRVVYYYLSMAPSQVEDAGDLGRYVVSGFLLYLRISGQFHVIVGMLKLFGFNLPETHHLYFLSTSFTDFWRRINIYWKDFMMKVFFYPAFFRLRKRGDTTALVLSTIFVFFMTWVLHAYQWFWIRGTYLFTATDILFWTALGFLVVLNTVYEARHGTERLVSARPWTVGRLAGLVARTAGTFVVIASLWSLWTSASVGEWLGVWQIGLERPYAGDRRLIPAALLGAVCFVAATIWFALRERERLRRPRPAFGRSVSAVLAVAAIAVVAGTPELYARYLPAGVARPAYDVMASTREVRLSGHDEDMLERGYYEDLLSVQSFNTQLWQVLSSWPIEWSRLEDTGVLRRTGDFLKQDLVPSQEIHFRNATLTTNRWGMRDRDYEAVPPPGTTRIALVGSSHVMGYGVSDDQTFDARVEARLAEGPLDPGATYEVLNFAVDGYNPLQELRQLDTKVLELAPHVVLYFAHYGAPYRAAVHLAEMRAAGIEVPYPELEAILERAGIGPGLGRFELERRIGSVQEDVLSAAYRRMVAASRERGALPVWVYLPQITDEVPEAGLARLTRLAADAGFVTLSLDGVFDGHAPARIWFGEWDHHPNAFGHDLIAGRLYEELVRHRDALGLAPATTAGGRQDR